MFSQFKNLDTAFKQVRSLAFLVIILCACITAYALYINQKVIKEGQQRIYILANGKAMEAFASGRKENIPVEAKDHIATFHHYFFTLDPDDKVIQHHIAKALYLADGSARRQYESLKENNYYTELITANISQEITIDSVWVNTASYPYFFRCRATQTIIRQSSLTTRSLQTEGYLRNVSRSDNNPHGFLIEKWITIENKDLKTTNR